MDGFVILTKLCDFAGSNGEFSNLVHMLYLFFAINEVSVVDIFDH